MFGFTIVRKGDAPKRRLTRKQLQDRNALRVVRLTLLLFAAVSVACNIRDTASHTLDPLALGLSVIWPAGGVLVVEVLTIVQWKEGRLRAAGRYALLGGAALMMMVISISHTQSVLEMWGFDTLTTWAGPILIDIVMMFLGVALITMRTARPATSQRNRSKPSKPAAGRTRSRKRPAPVSTPAPVPVPQLAAA
jgi:hypothetical protein